jgi:acetylornithine deacetylase/succinyl-diaminopimelate desuccinylase-like protein
MDQLKPYLTANRARFLDELFEVLRIPSISAQPERKEDVLKTAEWFAQKLRDAGADNVEVAPTKGYPIVLGEKMIDKKLPTVLVYGHYDVQPPDSTPDNPWISEPFDPTIRVTPTHPEGAIFARGSCDDKGQTYMHLKAFEMMMRNNALPCNVKFIIEGEEEVGSPNFLPFVQANKERLACDVVLCSDTSIIANDTPSITTGVRGLAYFEIEVTGANRDLHSGTYGGGVANPINILSKMIASLHDKNGHITIPEFYDDVEVVGKTERKNMNKAPFVLENYQKDLNIDDVQGEKGYTTLERTSIRPTLDCNGIWGGYMGAGSKTVLPSKAYAKFSCRLVPYMRSEKIYEIVERHLLAIAPKSVKVKVTRMHGGEPGVTPTNTLEYKAAHMAMETTFGKAPIPKREGGYIPIVSLFKDELNVDSILMGFGLDSDSIHSPNEHYGVFNYFKGIETIPYFYKYYTELKK